MLKHLPQNREALELAVDLRLEMRPWLRMLGEQKRVVEQFSEAESLAEELGDKRRLAHVFADSCAYFSQEGEQSALSMPANAPWSWRPKWEIPPSRLMHKSA